MKLKGLYLSDLKSRLAPDFKNTETSGLFILLEVKAILKQIIKT